MATAASVSPLRVGTLKRLTTKHPYFSEWQDRSLKSIEQYADLLSVAAGGDLLALNELSPYDFFLLQGSLRLQPEEGVCRTMTAGDLDAGFPIAHLRPSQYRVTAESPATFLRIEASKLRHHAAEPREARYRLDDKLVGGTWRAHPLVAEVMGQLRAGTLKIPPIPGVALRMRKAMAEDDIDMGKIATLVGADPTIAARLIKVANSSLFGGAQRCESVHGALVRLGLERAQNIVLTIATKGLFVTKKESLKKQMMTAWRHAIDIAALCAVLSELTPSTANDKGLLVGLLHEIGGIPILRLAENHGDLAENPGILQEILMGLTPEISAQVLERWQFTDDFVHAAVDQSNWFREHDGEADYTDVIVIAHLHALVRQRDFQKLPRIDETPAFQKLALGQLSPELSLHVLDESRAQINELRDLLI